MILLDATVGAPLTAMQIITGFISSLAVLTIGYILYQWRKTALENKERDIKIAANTEASSDHKLREALLKQSLSDHKEYFKDYKEHKEKEDEKYVGQMTLLGKKLDSLLTTVNNKFDKLQREIHTIALKGK